MKVTENWGDVVTPRKVGDQTFGGVLDCLQHKAMMYKLDKTYHSQQRKTAESIYLAYRHMW